MLVHSQLEKSALLTAFSVGFGVVGYLGSRVINHIVPQTIPYLNPRLGFLSPMLMSATIMALAASGTHSLSLVALSLIGAAFLTIAMGLASKLPLITVITTIIFTNLPIYLIVTHFINNAGRDPY